MKTWASSSLLLPLPWTSFAAFLKETVGGCRHRLRCPWLLAIEQILRETWPQHGSAQGQLLHEARPSKCACAKNDLSSGGPLSVRSDDRYIGCGFRFHFRPFRFVSFPFHRFRSGFYSLPCASHVGSSDMLLTTPTPALFSYSAFILIPRPSHPNNCRLWY